MTDLPTSDIQFDGVGATAGSAEEAVRVLEFRVQSASTGVNLELTAIFAFLEESSIAETLATAAAEVTPEVSETVAQAEEIIADSRQEKGG